MSQESLSMKKLKEVLRLHYESELSNRQIARALKLSPTTVGHYVNAADASGMKWSEASTLGHGALLDQLLPFCSQLSRGCKKAAVDFRVVHQQLKKKGVTRNLLHKEYASTCRPGEALSYTEFCRQYRIFKKQLKPSMRQTHIGGEKVFVDYAGPTVAITDQQTGEVNQAVIFVGVLGASNYTYAEATRSRSLTDWIGSHVRMFEFFGGVSNLIVSDNEKSAVHKACHYDPDVNPNYTALAAHYNTAVLPTRPYHPQDKAKVEAGVQLVERWILARLRHQTFFSLDEVNAAICQLLIVLNNKPFQKLPGSRRSAFEAIDKPALKPLPSYPYEFAIIKSVQVRLDYHVEVAQHYYSVPHRYINQRVEYHLTDKCVAIFHQGERIALHSRAYAAGKTTTLTVHMPKAHCLHQQWTPAAFLLFARPIGKAMITIAAHLIETKPHPEHCYRTHLGFTHLAKQYGKNRLEKACCYAIKHQLLSFSHVKSILKTSLDQATTQATANSTNTTASKTPAHKNLRGACYYTENTGENNT